MLRDTGINVELVDGKHATGARKTYIEALERGDLDVLICTVIFQEGVDIPDLQSVIIATGGASSIAAIQRMGRGMRKVAGKTTFEVWDIMDTGDKWLEKHSRERGRAYLDEGHEVRVGPIAGPTAPFKVRRRKRRPA
jgi:superfamily II DNA or RNA helicase